MAIFLFVFLFSNALPPIFPISTRCFVLYFHMLFLFFNPRTGKEGRHLNDKDVDWIVSRVFLRPRVFREGLFERGKVIFAPHDTKWRPSV